MKPSPRLAIVDWGIGGMGVWKSLRAHGDVPVLYLSDTGTTPYGRLPRDELAARLSLLFGFLVRHGAVGIVVACNAASTVLPDVPDAGVPVMGMIEAASEVVGPRFRGTLGVIGGIRTIRSGIYRRTLAAPGRRVVTRIAQPLSAHVEAGTTDTPACARDLDRILRPLARVDALLLACTHYPAIAPRIAERLPGVRLLDPADAVAARVRRELVLPTREAADLVLTTGNARAMHEAAKTAWGFEPGQCHHLTALL